MRVQLLVRTTRRLVCLPCSGPHHVVLRTLLVIDSAVAKESGRPGARASKPDATAMVLGRVSKDIAVVGVLRSLHRALVLRTSKDRACEGVCGPHSLVLLGTYRARLYSSQIGVLILEEIGILVGSAGLRSGKGRCAMIPTASV